MGRFRSARGKACFSKKPFVAIISQSALCPESLKGDIDPRHACRNIPSKPSGSHRNNFVRGQDRTHKNCLSAYINSLHQSVFLKEKAEQTLRTRSPCLTQFYPGSVKMGIGYYTKVHVPLTAGCLVTNSDFVLHFLNKQTIYIRCWDEGRMQMPMVILCQGICGDYGF